MKFLIETRNEGVADNLDTFLGDGIQLREVKVCQYCGVLLLSEYYGFHECP